jgi:virulence factor Mce-like protein
MLERVNGRAMAIAVAVLLLAATFFVFLRPHQSVRTVTAHFSRAVSIYKGSEVRVLGVPVGTVTDVVPEGNSVRVEMQYDAQYKVPADAKAAIVTPTLVADRFVQLSPAYTSGPVMRDDADIPLSRTANPVELDRIYQSLRDLSQALGPNGVNKDGSLDTLLAAGRKTLEGQGATGNRMILDLARAAQTFGKGSGELFGTVRELAEFTSVLARNDAFVSSFIRDLAGVSGELASERHDLRAALAALAQAVGTVQTFVHRNRHRLDANLKALADVAGTIAKEKDSLALALEKGPLGAGNLTIAYDNPTGSIGGRIVVGPNADDTDGFLCDVVKAANIPHAKLACRIFSAIIERLPQGQVPPNQDTSKVPSSSSQPGAAQPATSLRQLLGGRS